MGDRFEEQQLLLHHLSRAQNSAYALGVGGSKIERYMDYLHALLLIWDITTATYATSIHGQQHQWVNHAPFSSIVCGPFEYEEDGLRFQLRIEATIP